mmetsp:Transcript_7690/g.10978  ORF Transcript_7690/g.10978 Transcript_7690/m.10978 type:complete len:441 (+) Transcript_7690:244-1566(+)
MQRKVNPSDRPIIATADDAILAKRATVAAGYYEDPFVEAIAAHASGMSSSPAQASRTLSPLHETERFPGASNRLPSLDEGENISNQINSSQQPVHHPPNSGSPVPVRRTMRPSPFPANNPMRPSPSREKHQQPIIKRGTHARVCCIDRAITAFAQLVHEKKDRQIVVLGAGKDTNWFRYRAGLLFDDSKTDSALKWFEVDHPSVVYSKAKLIQNAPELTSQFALELKKIDSDEYILSDTSAPSNCYLVSHDLRSSPQELIGKLSRHNFDPAAPTLFILECVQMYLPEDANSTLLRFLSGKCPNACVCLFDPILGNDPFGKMMEQNLLRAGVVTQDSCLLRTRTLSEHLTKADTYGFDRGVGCDMMSAYETVVTDAQRRRANQCEMLDELEEWILIMRHYCIVVCCRSDSDFGQQYCGLDASSPIGFVGGKCLVLDRGQIK